MQLLVDRLDGLDRVGRLCTCFGCIAAEAKKKKWSEVVVKKGGG